MRRGLLFGLLLCLFGLCAGCGNGDDGFGCTAEVRPGIIVSVINARTGQPIYLNATATLQEGTYTETMRAYNTELVGGIVAAFQYVGADERAGIYTVRVTVPGYIPWERRNVVVTEDVCHVNTVTLRAELEPAP
jgi:hypothetical protein